MENLIGAIRAEGRQRTAEIYRSALSSFGQFTAGRDMRLSALTTAKIDDYEAWQRRRGLKANTISFYTRVLRAAYNRAVERGLVADRRPFRRAFTGNARTAKRALTVDVIGLILRADLGRWPSVDHARDLFILSFYLRGMSFIDMAYLRKADLNGTHLSYRRHKTGQQLQIEWTREMQAIVDKYPANPTEFLLPILTDPSVDARRAYRNASYNVNYNLRRLHDILGLPSPLTMYVARHSWASIARSKGIPISVISAGMGHDSEATTRIYLAALDTETIDRANAAIISSI